MSPKCDGRAHPQWSVPNAWECPSCELVNQHTRRFALGAGLSMRKSKQLVPALGRRRKGIAEFNTRQPAPRPPSISDVDIIEEVSKQSVAICRWSAKLKRPNRTLLGSRRRVWRRLKKINRKIGYRQFCRRTKRGKVGVERAQNRYDYDEN